MTDESRHPDVDRLAAYVAGTLDETAADAVAEHLVACPECSDVVLDLDALAGPAGPLDEVGAIDDLAHERAWRRLSDALRDDRPATPWRALAAGLALAVLGLGLWSTSLQRTNETLRARLAAAAGVAAVRPDLPVVYLDLVRSDATVVRLEPDQDYLLLLVDPTADARAYRAALHAVSSDSGASDSVWSGALRRSEDGGLRLGLPAPPSGEYRLRVEGATGEAADGWAELVTYRLRVERTDTGDRPATGGG